MLRIMSDEQCHPTVISLSRNDVFYARHVVPSDAERYAQVTILTNKETRLIMQKDCIAVVEDLQRPYMRADLVVFMREDRSREGMHSLWFARPKEMSNLREALTFLNIPQAHIVTGVTDAVIYSDEILVPDYGKRGPYGWIIKQEDASRYIAVLPKGRDSGKMEALYIWCEAHATPGGGTRISIRVEGWSKYPDPYKDNATMRSVDEYIILFDTGSRIIKEILMTDRDGDAVPCDKGPLRGHLGQRVVRDVLWSRGP